MDLTDIAWASETAQQVKALDVILVTRVLWRDVNGGENRLLKTVLDYHVSTMSHA